MGGAGVRISAPWRGAWDQPHVQLVVQLADVTIQQVELGGDPQTPR